MLRPHVSSFRFVTARVWLVLLVDGACALAQGEYDPAARGLTFKGADCLRHDF
jgi:hypothetical protein